MRSPEPVAVRVWWNRPEVPVENTHCQMVCVCVCPTVCSPRDCRIPGSSVHGIFQARILEWVPSSSSRGSSQHQGSSPLLLHLLLLPPYHLGSHPHIHTQEKIYSKKLDHMITEPEKSRGCTQQAGASADLTYGSSPSPTLENWESWCEFQPQSQLAREPIRTNGSMGLWRLEKAHVPGQWTGSGNYLAFFFYSGHHLIEQVSPTLRRTLCFLLSLWI